MIRDLTEIEVDEIDERLYEVLDDYESQHLRLGIEYGSKIIAAIFGRTHAKDVLSIYGPYVEKEHRGNGYGKALVEELEKKAENLGFAVLRAKTKNGHGEDFYRSAGYEQAGFYEDSALNIREAYFVKMIGATS